MCKVGPSLQTAMAYRADMPSFYLKIVWVTSVLCATSKAGTWKAHLTSQNRHGTRSVVSVDFLLWTGLNSGAERAWLELSCVWMHLPLAWFQINGGAPHEVVICDLKACLKGAGPQVSLWIQNDHSSQIPLGLVCSNLWRLLVLHSLSEAEYRKCNRKFSQLCWRSSTTQVRGDQQC